MDKQIIELLLGFEITEEEFHTSKKRAQRKLESIISRYGDENGERKKVSYLIQLISEDVRQSILSESTLVVANNVLNMEKEHSAKSQSTLLSQPYCSM